MNKILSYLIGLALVNVAMAENVTIPSAASAIQSTTELEAELKQKDLELREKLVEIEEKNIAGQQKSVDWWIGGISFIFAVVSIGIPYLMTRNANNEIKNELKEIKAIKEEILIHKSEADSATTAIRTHAEEMKNLISQVKNTQITNSVEQQTPEQQAGIQAAQELLNEPNVPLIEQLRAQALLTISQAIKSEKYEDYEQAFYQWQAVLSQDRQDEQACFYLGLAAQGLYQQSKLEQKSYWFSAVEKYYRKTLKIKPNYYQVENNWGIALASEAQALAQAGQLSEALHQWQQASEHFHNALQIKSDFHDAEYNWGIALASEAQALAQAGQLPEALHKWQQAGEHFHNALQIKSDYHEAENNWGNALASEAQALAQAGQLSEALHKWQQASEHFHNALQIKSDFHEAEYNWGNALASEAQALAQDGRLSEALHKWQHAGEHYYSALQIKPDDYGVINNWLDTLLQIHHAIQSTEPNTAYEKLKQARNLIDDFLQKYPQFASKLAYNHACLCAIENKPDKAIEQLTLAQQNNELPSKEHIENDRDFDNIRNTDIFQTWFTQAFPID